jgi:hypothetical protein
MDVEVKDLGTLIDTLYATRQQRLEITKQVDALKADEAKLRGTILQILETVGLAKASGHLATAGVKTSIEPSIIDWDEVHGYIREHDRFDLLQKRISAPAWRDLYNEGVTVPGTVPEEVIDLSLTKSVRG